LGGHDFVEDFIGRVAQQNGMKYGEGGWIGFLADQRKKN